MPISPTLSITPRRPVITTIPAAPLSVSKPVVSGYARVSRIESGENSLENQIIHLEKTIHNFPDYSPGSVYHDSISGTQAHNRPGLQALLKDCREGKCQVVVIKSISRLARNTADLLSIVRELSSIGVTIIFERENIRTDQMSSEFLLTVLASFATSESTSIGANVRLGHRSKFELGTHKVFNPPYGFDVVNGELVINEAEAEIVREIYSRIEAGEGTFRIARDLDARKVPTKRGGKWDPQTVRSITKNPANIGTIVNQKTYRADHKVCVNRGELEMFIEENKSPSLVPTSVFDHVSEIVAARRAHYNTFMLEEDEENALYRLQRTCFSSHIFCNSCGSVLHRGNQYRSGPDIDPVMGKGWTWKCKQHYGMNPTCSMTPIKEADITRAFLNMVNKIVYSQTTDLPLLDIFIEAQLGDEAERNATVLEHLNDELQKIEYERQIAVNLAQRCAIAPHTYREKMNSLQRREGEIRQAQIKLGRGHSVEETRKLKTLLVPTLSTTHSSSGPSASPSIENAITTTFDEVLFAGIVERVVVQSKQFVTFELKCGLRFTEYFAELSDYPGISNRGTSKKASSPEKTETKSETIPFKLPYGYRRAADGIEIVPEEAEKLKVFFHLLSTGEPVSTAGEAAGIPRKGSSLHKIAHRRAYGGTALFPAIVDPSMIAISTHEDRRSAFVPLYSAFEYGIIPEIAEEKTPAECVQMIYGEIRPVAAFEHSVADCPLRRPSAKVTQNVTACLAAPTPVKSVTSTEKRRDQDNDQHEGQHPDADPDIILPVVKTSRKIRVVDLAIEMHNRRLAAQTATAPKPENDSAAPEHESVKPKNDGTGGASKPKIAVTVTTTRPKKEEVVAPNKAETPLPHPKFTVTVSTRTPSPMFHE